MVKQVIILFILLGLFLGGIFGLKTFNQQKNAASMSQPRPPAVVASFVVEARVWQPELTAIGTLLSSKSANLSSEVAGLVKEVHFESAQTVKEGEVLLNLNDKVDRAHLDGLKAELKLAEIKFRRAKELLPKRVVSLSDYDEAQAEFEAAKAKIAEQEALISQKIIVAPFSGVLGFRYVNVGDYVPQGTKIVTLNQPSSIWVEFELPQRYSPLLAIDQKITMALDTFPNELFQAKVIAIDPAVQVLNRTIQIRAEYKNVEGKLKPGMFAKVNLLQSTENKVLVLPETALSYNPYGSFVFKIEKNEPSGLVVKRQSVETGEVRAGFASIIKGLSEGDQIVRAGLIKLKDGQLVQVDNQVKLNDAEVKPE